MKRPFLPSRYLLLLLTLLLGLNAQAQQSIHYVHVDLNTANAGRAAYMAGDFDAATAFFAQLLPRPTHLQQYYFGVLINKAIEGDSTAVRYINSGISNDTLHQLTAPVRIYLGLRSHELSLSAAQAAFEKLDFNAFLDHPTWQLHASLVLFACMDEGSDTSFNRLQLRNLHHRLPAVEAPKSADDWPDIRAYLTHLYQYEAEMTGFSLSEAPPAFQPLQRYNLRRLALYQTANQRFRALDELLQRRFPADADALQKQLVLLFSNPSTTYFEQWLQLEGVEQLSSTAMDRLLTADWTYWPHAELLHSLYPDSLLTGKWLLVDVWGSWCRPCLAQLPQFQQLKAQLDSLGTTQLQLLTLVDRTPRLEQFMEEHDYDFPTAPVNESQVKSLGIHYFPTTWLISPAGKYLQLRDWPALHPWFYWLAQRP